MNIGNKAKLMISGGITALAHGRRGRDGAQRVDERGVRKLLCERDVERRVGRTVLHGVARHHTASKTTGATGRKAGAWTPKRKQWRRTGNACKECATGKNA